MEVTSTSTDKKQPTKKGAAHHGNQKKQQNHQRDFPKRINMVRLNAHCCPDIKTLKDEGDLQNDTGQKRDHK